MGGRVYWNSKKALSGIEWNENVLNSHTREVDQEKMDAVRSRTEFIEHVGATETLTD
jgi:hypothetical protein